MELICEKFDPEIFETVYIYKPSRGIGGTLAYPCKVKGQFFVFETNDEGNWQPFPHTSMLSGNFIIRIEAVIVALETLRLKNKNI